MTLKALHKYQLRLLALQSLADQSVKDLLAHVLSKECSTKVSIDKLLGNLLKQESKALKRGHFLATFPRLQSLIYEDATLEQIKDQIDISKLEALLVIEILEKTSLGKLESVDSLSKAIKVISNYRILAAKENSDAFWEQFDQCEERDVLLSFDESGSKTWSSAWKENEKSVKSVLKFLNRNNVVSDVDFNRHLEEIRLFGNWSKQEVLQNWYHPIEKQIKSLSFLHQLETQCPRYKEVEIALRISNFDLKSRTTRSDGLLSSIIEYLKSLVYTSNTNDEPEVMARIEDIELDSDFASMVTLKMKSIVGGLFGGQGLIETALVEVSKGIKVTEARDEEDCLLPVTLTLDIDQSCNIEDSGSDESMVLWTTLSEEISKCIQETIGIDVDLYRTSWFKEKNKITVFIIKYSITPWYQSECDNIVRNLQDWTKFSVPIAGARINEQLLANLATMVYRISTHNQRFFYTLERFAIKFNERSTKSVVLADEFKFIDIIEKLDLKDSYQSLQNQVNNVKTKNFEPEPKTKEAKSNIEILSTPRGEKALSSRKASPRNPTASAPRSPTSNIASPRDHPTSNASSPPKSHRAPDGESTSPSSQQYGDVRPGLSREQSFSSGTRSNEPSPRKENGTSPRNKRANGLKKKQPVIPIIQQNGIEIHSNYDSGEDLDAVDGSHHPHRLVPLSVDWVKRSVAIEFVLKPALLSVMHNSQNGLPTHPKLLFKKVKELQRNHHKAFEVWRKSEMNNIILPNDGKGEVDCNLWTVDIIYFMIRTSNIVTAPGKGWQNPKPPGTNEDGRGYWCCEARRLKNNIQHDEIDDLLYKVAEIAMGLDFYDGMELLEQLRTESSLDQIIEMTTQLENYNIQH